MLLQQPNVKILLWKIEAALSPTEQANEENKYFEVLSGDLYYRLKNIPLQGHDRSVGYREDYKDALTIKKSRYYIWLS